jgi:hypothetical protein
MLIRVGVSTAAKFVTKHPNKSNYLVDNLIYLKWQRDVERSYW